MAANREIFPTLTWRLQHAGRVHTSKAHSEVAVSVTSMVPNAEVMHAGVVNAVDARLIEQVKRKQVPIAVIGMGHVGLPTALGFASLGWTVLGVDSSEALISLIAEGKVPFYEPGLDELLKQQLGKNFLPVVDMDEAIRQATILFLCVGTPQKENGQADLSQVEAAARTIAHNLNGYKLIVEKSTVPAITAQWICRTIRRFATNGNSNPQSLDFDVASNPEFLQEGVALRNISRPERIVCGVESMRARRMLEEVYRPVPARVLITGTSTAEIIKHAANSFLSMKISFINMVSDLCDAIGADVSQVAEGIGMDPRIGSSFLQAGIGFGGYCFPKDLRAFIYLAEEYGIDFSLLKKVEEINEKRTEMFIKKLRNALWVLHDKTIAVLGLAFKAGTDDTRESPSLRILDALRKEGATLRLHDPKAMPLLKQVVAEEDGKLTYCESPYAAAANAQALLILTDWAEYKLLDWARLRQLMELPLIVDGRNLLDPDTIRDAGFEYISVGRPAM
jgi:UDPglucose 6-dehydrogenase